MRLSYLCSGVAAVLALIGVGIPASLPVNGSRYTVLDEAPAGEGVGTVVRKIRRSVDLQVYAAKFFDLSDRWQKQVMTREYFFGHILDHGSIARTVDVVDDSSSPYIVMEYFPTEMLTVLVRRELSSTQTDILFKQILTGVAHMHSLGIAHRDLKMDNVLLDESGNAKIIDLGSASFGRNTLSGETELAYGLWGSQPFSAPECQEERKYDPIMADIWSLGVLYISMVLGDLPWDSATWVDEAFAHFFGKGNEGHESLMGLVPPRSRPIVDTMLNLDPNRRPDMVAVFADSWISSIRV